MTQENKSANKSEKMGFKAEVNQLLHLVTHALYSNKEIFLRELISNASDAADKLRFEALSDNSLYEGDSELKVWLEFDKDNRTLTLRDNGIGMTREDAINNLGTIAKSGTREFISQLTGDQSKDANLIGQFGVGFYSAFIVSDKVTVRSRRAGEKEGVEWSSKGDGEFDIAQIKKPSRGTDIIMHLKEGEDEFLEGSRLRTIVRKYSDHIMLPIEMLKDDSAPAGGMPDMSSMPGMEEMAKMMKDMPKPDEDKGDKKDEKSDSKAGKKKAKEVKKTEKEEKKEPEWESVNQATALWTMAKSEIKDEEYQGLYKHISHDYEDAMLWAHNKVEGKLEYTTLLYLPGRAPFDMYQRDQKHGLKLYVQRVFIMDDAEQLLPNYLRFVRGIVDSNDLPLNISREILQNNHIIDSMKSGCTKRVLGMIEKLAKDEDTEKYQKFWKEFGQVLKEGPAEDYANKERIAKLLRFSSTHNDNDAQVTSFEDYIGRMQEKQEKIYYVTAESYAAAKNSPHLEIFRKKGIEVLLLTDKVDEWLASHLTDVDGKHLQSVAKGDLDLGDLDDKKDKKEAKKQEKAFESVVKQMKEVLKDQVSDVKLTDRLTDSPACLVMGAHDMSLQMQEMMKAAGQSMMMGGGSKPNLELNPEHPIIEKLKTEADDEQFTELSHVLFDQAFIAEGGKLKDPMAFVKRLNKILLQVA